MSFIFATRVAIPLDPMSRVPRSLCGWEPWDTHLGDPKGKGPPGQFQRQEALTAPQGPTVTAEAGVVCSDRSAQFPGDPPQWQFQPPCLSLPGLRLAWRSRAPRPSCLHSPIALFYPGLTPVWEPHFSCLQASSHCYSTRTKRKKKLEKGKSVLTLLTIAVISCCLCQFVPSISYCV